MEWKQRERGLSRKIKSKDELIRLMTDEKNVMIDKIESLEKRVADKEQKI